MDGWSSGHALTLWRRGTLAAEPAMLPGQAGPTFRPSATVQSWVRSQITSQVPVSMALSPHSQPITMGNLKCFKDLLNICFSNIRNTLEVLTRNRRGHFTPHFRKKEDLCKPPSTPPAAFFPVGRRKAGCNVISLEMGKACGDKLRYGNGRKNVWSKAGSKKYLWLKYGPQTQPSYGPCASSNTSVT